MSDTLKLILFSSGFLGGVIGLLLFVARQVFSGKYFPASWVDQQRTHYNEQLAREREISENYRTSSDNLIHALDKQREQLDKVLEGQEIVKDFITALRSAMDADQQRRVIPRGRGQ